MSSDQVNPGTCIGDAPCISVRVTDTGSGIKTIQALHEEPHDSECPCILCASARDRKFFDDYDCGDMQ